VINNPGLTALRPGLHAFGPTALGRGLTVGPRAPKYSGAKPGKRIKCAAMSTDIQFEKAQFTGGNHCVTCQTPLQHSYFRLNDATLCPNCAEKARCDHQLEENQASGLPRGILFGLGAAAAGSILYGGVALLTGYEFALIAIAIGWMVGRAMIRGTRGRGGRRLQVAAVLITYLSITGGYIPAIVQEIMKSSTSSNTSSALSSDSASTTTAEAQAPAGPIGTKDVLLFVGFLLGFAAIVPFLSVTSISGLIGIFIIFVGLSKAWKETEQQPFAISGPFPFETPTAETQTAQQTQAPA
jgi:hypothetical protein